jgi:hypothetical protein
MWAVWLGLILGGVALFLLALSLLVGLSPLLGVVIFLLLAPPIVLFLRREGGEPGSEPAGAARSPSAKPSWLVKHWYE